MSGGDSLDFEILGSVTSQLQNLHKIIELNTDGIQRILLPVWLRNRFITTGLELVLSHTEKLCIASHYRQFSTKKS